MTTKSRTLRLPADQADALEAIAGVDEVSVNEEIRSGDRRPHRGATLRSRLSTAPAGQHRAQPGDPRTPHSVTVYLELADYLLIAEAVLGVPAELIADFEFVERNGRVWIPAQGDPDETDHVIPGIAGGEVSEAAFRDWIAQRCG